MSDERPSVIIADDHPVVRSGIRFVLEKDNSFNVIHEAANGDLALQLIRQSNPDVVILDVEMPVMDGFAVAKAIQAENLTTNIIIMTMHSDEQTFNKAMEYDVRGFVLKENAVSDIVKAVHTVLGGRHYISPSLTEYLMHTRQTTSSGIDLSVLTATESNILKLIAEEKTTKTIANELFISPKTVEKHRSNICSKLNLRGAYALLKFAMNNKASM